MRHVIRHYEGLGRRAWFRLPVVLPVLLRSGDLTFTAKLTNIARGGAKLETSAPILAGAEVIVSCGAIVGPAKVVWRSPGAMGVYFDVELSEAQVEEQVSRSQALAGLRGRSA